jgi:hypothetical protein
MRRVTALLLVLFAAAPAAASLQIVNIHQTGVPGDLLDPANIPPFPSNDFSSDLFALSLAKIVVGDIQLNLPGHLYFFAHASESGFTNTFKAGNSGEVSYTEPANDLQPWHDYDVPIGQILNVPAGTLLSSLNAIFTTTGSGGMPAAILSGGFGIFTEVNQNGSIKTGPYDEVFFGYDDNGAGPDDNHDDLIISVQFRPLPPGGTPQVPEPVSVVVWGLLAAATILVPGIARRR